MYSISVKLGNVVYESKGDSMRECLSTLPKPHKISQKGIVLLRKGDNHYEFFWMPHKLRKIWYKTAPTFLAKNLELLVA